VRVIFWLEGRGGGEEGREGGREGGREEEDDFSFVSLK